MERKARLDMSKPRSLHEVMEWMADLVATGEFDPFKAKIRCAKTTGPKKVILIEQKD